MYNKHLDSFLSVAATGSFSKAAEASHISRTALIQQINALETHLGFALFNRTSKGAELTAAGWLFAERAREIMHISAATIARCNAMQNKHAIRIGILPNLPLTLLSPVIIEYARLYPDVEISFVERSADEYLSSFLNSEFDISADYMSRLSSDDDSILFAQLAIDHFDCAVPPANPLANSDSIGVSDLKGKRVGLFVANVASAEDALRKLLTELVPGIDIVDVESYQKSLPLSCMLNGMFLLHYHLNAEEYEPLVSRPLDLGVACPIELGLCYKADASCEVRSFVHFAEEWCEKNLGSASQV